MRGVIKNTDHVYELKSKVIAECVERIVREAYTFNSLNGSRYLNQNKAADIIKDCIAALESRPAQSGGLVDLLQPMETFAEHDDCGNKRLVTENYVHEGCVMVLCGTNGKPIGWIDTHVAVSGRVYRHHIISAPAGEAPGRAGPQEKDVQAAREYTRKVAETISKGNKLDDPVADNGYTVEDALLYLFPFTAPALPGPSEGWPIQQHDRSDTPVLVLGHLKNFGADLKAKWMVGICKDRKWRLDGHPSSGVRIYGVTRFQPLPGAPTGKAPDHEGGE